MNARFSLKKSLPFLFSIILLSSCVKDPDLPPVIDPQPTGSLLKKVTINDTDSLVFEYGSNGNLQKITSTESEVGSGPTIFNFQYDASNRVKQIGTNAGVLYKFVYEGSLLKLIENYMDNEKVSENNFVWTGNRITSNTVFVGIEQGNGSTVYRPTYKATYQYDGAGILKKLSTFTVNSSTMETTPEYERVIDQVDNNYNPLSILEPINLVAFSEIYMPRNILEETLYNHQGQEEEKTVNTFVFDTQKRVVSAVSTITSPGYTPIPIHIKYYYQ